LALSPASAAAATALRFAAVGLCNEYVFNFSHKTISLCHDFLFTLRAKARTYQKILPSKLLKKVPSETEKKVPSEL